MNRLDELTFLLKEEFSDISWIADQMSNDEESSDEEMIDFFHNETKIDKEKLTNLVKKERTGFLRLDRAHAWMKGDRKGKNPKEIGYDIIKSYLE